MKIEHIGIAVVSIEEAARLYTEGLGLEVESVEEVPSDGVRAGMIRMGESRLELLESTRPGSPVDRFLQRRGPGLHHIAVEVDDIEAALARLRTSGARLVDDMPRPGAGGTRVAFLHPSSAGGVLLELVEHAG